MKKFVIATVVAVFAAVAFTALSVAAPWSGTARAKADTANALPALPPEVRQRRRWKIGVKCDFPPFGYINRQNRVAGYDAEVARRFAELAFGRQNRVTITCVTSPSRIPVLQQKRVDIIISTLTWTSAREEIIDYSRPYYNATGRLLVPNNSSIQRLADLNGRDVTTTTTEIYATWIRNCFRGARLNTVTSPVAAVENVKQGRADAFMFDDTFLLGVAANDATLKMTN